MRVKEDRSLGMYILLTICTCGIYSWYFIYTMAQDANTLCSGDGKKTPGLAQYILLSIITCGFYNIYWAYTLGNRLAENAPRYGVDFQENGSSVLLWYLFGAMLCGIGPFVAMHILIKNMNTLAHLYNNGAGENSHQNAWQDQPLLISQNGTDADGQVADAEKQGMHQNEENAYTKPEKDWMPDAGSAWKPKSETKEKPKASKPSGLVECLGGIYKGAKFPFEEEIVIGRDGACASIVIDNPKVSRRHCIIRYSPQNGGYLVTDTSSNGLFNKQGQAFPKNTPVACSAGTILVIGKSGNEFILK